MSSGGLRGIFWSDSCAAFHVQNVAIAKLPEMGNDYLHPLALVCGIIAVHLEEEGGVGGRGAQFSDGKR